MIEHRIAGRNGRRKRGMYDYRSVEGQRGLQGLQAGEVLPEALYGQELCHVEASA